MHIALYLLYRAQSAVQYWYVLWNNTCMHSYKLQQLKVPQKLGISMLTPYT